MKIYLFFFLIISISRFNLTYSIYYYNYPNTFLKLVKVSISFCFKTMKNFFTHFILNIDRLGLKFIIIFSLFSYFVSYFGMMILEPGLTDSFFWYFVVTVTTVWYGDVSPATFWGKFVGIFIIIFGGLFYTMLLAYLYTFSFKIINTNKRGLMKHNIKDHIIIMGYNAQKTQAIIDEIRAAKHKTSREILLCTYDQPNIESNPVEDYTNLFVRWSMETEDKVQKMIEDASMETAYCIIVDLEDDDRSLLAFTDLIENLKDIYIVVSLNHCRSKKFRFIKLYDNVECVNSHEVGYIVSAIQHPGTVRLLDNLSLNRKGHKVMRLNLSKKCNFTYYDLSMKLKKELNVQLIATTNSHAPNSPVDDNPNCDVSVSNKGILYVSDRVIQEEEILELFHK